jgi:hypothetical protein
LLKMTETRQKSLAEYGICKYNLIKKTCLKAKEINATP